MENIEISVFSVDNKLKIYLATLLVSSLIWAQPLSGGPRVTTLILILLGLFVLAKRLFSIKDVRLTRFTIILLLFWVPALFSLIGSFDRLASLKFITLLPLFIPFAAGMLYLFDNYLDKKLLFNIVLAVCVFWMVDGLIQLILGHDIFGIGPRDGERIVGPFAYHLRLSLFLSITLPLVISRLENLGWGWLLGYLASVMFIIMLSGVRTDLLTALMAVTLYVIIKKRAKLILIVIPLIFIGGILASHYSNLSEHKLKSFSGVPDSYSEWNQALSNRLDIWLTAWNMYIDNPVAGVGAKAFRDAYDEYKETNDIFNEETFPVSHAHHPIISIAAETGTIGLAGLLVAVWLSYRWGASSPNENILAIPWLQMLILMFFPIQSMPILFTPWWFPVVSMVILYYLSEINAKQLAKR